MDHLYQQNIFRKKFATSMGKVKETESEVKLFLSFILLIENISQ